MKVVYNNCYGGFGLSYEAMMRYAEIKGIKLYAFVDERDENYISLRLIPATIDNVKDAGLGLVYYCITPKYTNKGHFSDRDIERDDPALVQVVEELGRKADGMCAKLAIDEVPAGTAYRIDEYDGNESVMTNESYDWKIAH